VAKRIVMHVGAPKTGTTFLQAVLFHNRERLQEQGVVVPGRSRFDHGQASTGVRQGAKGKKYPAWQQLVAEVEETSDTVIISNEWFSMASAERARSALDDLGDTETHLVFTARDFVDQVPSAWQETLKLGDSTTLEDFVASLGDTDDRWRWSVLDPAEVLHCWGAGLPADHVHVVTTPPRGADPGLLWQRFAAACGIDPDSFETELNQARESLGVEAARLLQEIGPSLRIAVEADKGRWRDGYWRGAYQWIQRYFSHELLVPPGGGRIALQPADFEAVRARSHRCVATLREAGYDVVGDLDDLMSATVPADARTPEDVTDSELLAVALPLLPELLAKVRSEHQRAEEAIAQLASRGQ